MQSADKAAVVGVRTTGILSDGGERINEYLDYVLRAREPDTPVDATFRFIGERFPCDRVYIFELTGRGTFSNTYEWCDEGIVPQIDMLQEESIEAIDWWLRLFRSDRPVVIRDLEEIKDRYPHAYAALKPQDIRSLVTTALRSDGEIIGFIGVDNPSVDQIPEVASFLSAIGSYIVTFVHHNNRLKELRYLCSHDQLTGALNRHAFSQIDECCRTAFAIGVIYCDISGLKIINDYVSHRAGDAAIVRCYQLIRGIFPFDRIYRLGGDEFVVLCADHSREEFENKIDHMLRSVRMNEQHIAIGSSWTDHKPINIRVQLSEAESHMYEDKLRYYRNQNPLVHAGGERRYADTSVLTAHEILEPNPDSTFLQFIQSNYFNSEVLVRSIASADGTNYLYFGDLQTNLFYISDNMRDTFGFQNNIVPDLIGAWEKRISSQEDLVMYRKDIAEIMLRKKDIHDLRYRVKDTAGNDIWIHCRGNIHWDADRTTPLFFSGCIVRQEQDFVIDPITNFPREFGAITKLSSYEIDNVPISVIGFGLNNFSEINELRGRHVADRLLGDIARRLVENFEGRLQFFRLDGLRFIAVLSTSCNDRIEVLVDQIRDVVVSQYRSHSVMVKNPCALSILYAEPGEILPYEILSKTIALLTVAKSSPDLDYVVHSSESLEEQHRQAEMVFELSKNVQNDLENFRIAVQPTVSRDRSIAGAEVLLRWRFNGTDVSPEVFIPILEKNRLISTVGKWVFEQTVRITKRVLALNPGFYMAFNVSYIQVLDPEFFPYMAQIIKTYELDASRLVLELTETNFDDSPQKLQAFFESCRKLGLRVALDDFGNGYSSLGLLLKYPTNIVKLDRTMLNEMTTSEDNRKFISSIVYACHSFGKLVCAEGVETAEELGMVLQTDCDMIQGYYFSKPLELDEFYRLVTERVRF